MGAAPERQQWVDAARGIGILVVVYAHALRGHVTSGAFDPAWHAKTQDAIIYAFHMPLFFFLSGLFVQRSLRKGRLPFLREKAVTLVYPYLLWSIVSILLGAMAAGAVNNANSPSAILDLWHSPVYQFWFLYVLLAHQLVTLVTLGNRVFAALLSLVSAVGIGTAGYGMLSMSLTYYVYFGVGILLAPYTQDVARHRTAIIAGALAAAAVFVASLVLPWPAPEQAMQLTRAIAGIVMTIGLALLLGHVRGLVLLGTASMAIYVLHTIFSAGVRMGLRAVGFSDNLVALVLGTLVGVLMPLAVWGLARRYGWLTWLGLGVQPRGLGEARA